MSLAVVSYRADISVSMLSDFERCLVDLKADDLAALARVLDYPDPPALTREAVVMPLAEEHHA
jgi:hypothetical protein